MNNFDKVSAMRGSAEDSIRKNLHDAYPLQAYDIFREYNPFSTDKLVRLCEESLGAPAYKETLRGPRALEELKRLIAALRQDGEFIPIANLPAERQRRVRKVTSDFTEPRPTIIYGEASKEIESEHVKWLGNFIEHKNQDTVEGYYDAVDGISYSLSEMKWMNKEQREETRSEIASYNKLKSSFEPRMAVLRKIKNNPFFGRVDFTTNQSEQSNKVYITKIRQADAYPGQKDNVFYSDWRTPMGDLFYRSKGALGSYIVEDEARKIEANIDLNAHFVINDGKISDMHATAKGAGVHEDFSDDILQARLSQNSDEKMHEIVETLQPEQNEIMRKAGDRDLIIQGSAGSGKTILATHRLIYLMYAESLANNTALFISPNKNFSSYISEIAPELGENNFPVFTFNEIIECLLKDSPLGKGKIASIASLIEAYFNGSDDDNIKEKYSSAFYKKFNQVLADDHNFIDFPQVFVNRNSAIEALESVDINYDKKAATTKIKATYAKPFDKKRVALQAKKLYEDTLGCGKVQDASNYENITYYAFLYAKICHSELKISCEKNGALSLFLEDDNERASCNIAKCKQAIKEIEKEIKEFNIISTDFKKNPKAVLKQIDFDYSPDSMTDIRHIVIDEAQDYTELQIRLLRLIFPKAKFTILGDENQNLNPYIPQNRLFDLLPDADYSEIKIAYRSSPEIIKYTNNILDINIFPARKSQGINVKEFTVQKDISNLRVRGLFSEIARLRKLGAERIAIICREESEVNYLREFDDDLMIYTVYDAKGLEFDAAIVINTYRDSEKELFYTACTRAQHALVVYNIVQNAQPWFLRWLARQR